MDVRNDTTTCNSSFYHLIKFFITFNSKLNVSWCDAFLSAFSTCSTRKLDYFSTKVLKDCSDVNSRSSSNSDIFANSLFKESMDASNREL